MRDEGLLRLFFAEAMLRELLGQLARRQMDCYRDERVALREIGDGFGLSERSVPSGYVRATGSS